MIDTIYRCEICGEETVNPLHWVVVHRDDARLTLFKWDQDVAGSPQARHYCGEAHAQVSISRWFESYYD